MEPTECSLKNKNKKVGENKYLDGEGQLSLTATAAVTLAPRCRRDGGGAGKLFGATLTIAADDRRLTAGPLISGRRGRTCRSQTSLVPV